MCMAKIQVTVVRGRFAAAVDSRTGYVQMQGWPHLGLYHVLLDTCLRNSDTMNRYAMTSFVESCMTSRV